MLKLQKKKPPKQRRQPRPSTARIDVTRDASICVVTGGTGSGKSTFMKQRATVHAAHSERVLIWDVDAEYELAAPAQWITRTAKDFVSVAHGSVGVVIFRPRLVELAAQFDIFCKAALAVAPCVVVVEETADVTRPGKAPEGWGALIRRGRKYGVTIYAATQRPAESDKTSFRLATSLWIGQVNSTSDAEYLANEARVPVAQIEALQPLEYLFRDRRANTILQSKLTF